MSSVFCKSFLWTMVNGEPPPLEKKKYYKPDIYLDNRLFTWIRLNYRSGFKKLYLQLLYLHLFIVGYEELPTF